MKEVGNSCDPMAVAVKKTMLLVTCRERFRLFVPSFYRVEVLSTAE